MSTDQQLIEDFLRKGGKITRLPPQNFIPRADYEPVIKTSHIISDLKDRATKIAAEG